MSHPPTDAAFHHEHSLHAVDGNALTRQQLIRAHALAAVAGPKHRDVNALVDDAARVAEWIGSGA